MANIPAIQMKAELIYKIINTSYVDDAGIEDFEYIREELRGLMKYVPENKLTLYNTNFTDDILSTEWHEADLESDDLKNYRAKAEYYIRQHQDNIVIAKLKTNKPLSEFDVQALEEILWNEIGTKEEYEKNMERSPLENL